MSSVVLCCADLTGVFGLVLKCVLWGALFLDLVIFACWLYTSKVLLYFGLLLHVVQLFLGSCVNFPSVVDLFCHHSPLNDGMLGRKQP